MLQDTQAAAQHPSSTEEQGNATQSVDGVTATIKPQQTASEKQLHSSVGRDESLRQGQKAGVGMSQSEREAASSQPQECDTIDISAEILTGDAGLEQVAAALQQSGREAAQPHDAACPLVPKSAEEATGSGLSGANAAGAPSVALPSAAKSQPGPESSELPGLTAAALPCEALLVEGVPAQGSAACSQPGLDAAEAPAIAVSGLPGSAQGSEGCQSPSLRAAAPPCKALQGVDTSALGAAGPAACPLPGLGAAQHPSGTSTVAPQPAQGAVASPQVASADAAGFSMTVQETEILGRELCAKVRVTPTQPKVQESDEHSDAGGEVFM